MPPRRRVLLPGGPQGPQDMGHHAPPAIHAPLPQSSNGQLPPPSVVVPTIASSHGPPHHSQYPQMPPRGGFFPPAPMSQQQQQQQSPPRNDLPPVQQPQAPAPAPQFDISQMLARIANQAPIDDSPASPPMYGNEPMGMDPVRSIPEKQEVVWRLLPVEVSRPYSGIEPRTTSNDPRMSRVIASQFDAVSNLFANDGAGLMSAGHSTLIDPRVRDPRRRPDDRKVDDNHPMSSWMPQIA